MVRSDLFNLNYYRQADFTGSKGNISYRLSLDTPGDGAERFLLQWWEGPFSTARTSEEKSTEYFPYTNEGLDEIAAFIDAMEVSFTVGDMFKKVMEERGGVK